MTLSGRRDFLKGAGLGAAGLALSTPAAAAGQPASHPDFKIVRVTATALASVVPFDYGGVNKPTREVATYVEVETAGGLIGHGITTIVDPFGVADLVNQIAAPAIVGEDALRHEAIWDKLYWLLSPRGQTGFAGHVMSSIDIALWDIKGKATGQPIASLLGGARTKVPLYCTFGGAALSTEELVAVAKAMKAQGYRDLKMVVGANALQRRDVRPMDRVIAEDTARVRAVREAVGDDMALYIDGNCSFDFPNAERLVRAVEPYRIRFFEEPLTQNDAKLMADLRRATGIAVAAGQNETLAFRFRDFLLADAVDYVQPNVMMGGGYTQAVKILGMAGAFNVASASGGAGALQNMHMHAGLANGGYCEWHLSWMGLCRAIYRNMPEPVAGTLTLPQGPGLGFEPDRDAIREIARREKPPAA